LSVHPAYGVRAVAEWWHSDERGWVTKTLSAKQIETLLAKADQAGWIK
jgi:hypothetical protein